MPKIARRETVREYRKSHLEVNTNTSATKMVEDEEEWFEIGRTDTIRNNTNPDFLKSIPMDYFFEKQ